MALSTPTVITGECDACPKTGVTIHKADRNMMLCDTCLAQQNDAVKREAATTKLIHDAGTINTQITVKADIFNAAILSHGEVKAAIDHDDTIPADQKDYVMAQKMLEQVKHLQQVIFGQRQELIDNEARLRAAQTDVQVYAGKLRTELREQFKGYDVAYQPTPVKNIKPKAVPTQKKKVTFDKKAVYDAAAKYKVPAQQVQSILISKPGMNAEAAAKHLAEMLGLI